MNKKITPVEHNITQSKKDEEKGSSLLRTLLYDGKAYKFGSQKIWLHLILLKKSAYCLDYFLCLNLGGGDLLRISPITLYIKYKKVEISDTISMKLKCTWELEKTSMEASLNSSTKIS